MKSNLIFSVTFWINKSKKNSEGKCPLWCRITVNKERSEISLHENIEPDKWNIKKGKVKGSDEDTLRINKLIGETEAALNNAHDKLKYEKQIISAYNLKKEFHGKSEKIVGLVEASKSFLSYAVNEIGKSYAKGTVKNYYGTVKFLEAFVKAKYRKDDIDIRQIRPSFATDFKQYVTSLNKSQICHQNGFIKHLERLKRIMRWAKFNEWITENPFSEITEIKTKTSKVYLTNDELKKVEFLQLPKQGIGVSRDRFLFCCYTGLAYCDLSLLSPAHISLDIKGRKWISIRREKSKEDCIIPILDEVKDILEHYMNLPSAFNGGRIFPHIELQPYNKSIKRIMAMCGINKNIASHSARHTFGTTICANNGVPITTCAKMMGHAILKTTQIYYQTTPERMSMDIDGLTEKLNKRKDDLSERKLGAAN